MNTLMKNPPPALEIDDLRDLMRSVAETTERLETTHTALQNQVERLQRELSEANAQLQRSRSLAALGEMAAGIAHEIRNPLGSIQLYVQALADDLRERPEQAKLCEKVERAVVGLDAIVRDVLSFARDTTIHPRKTSAAELFDRAIDGCGTLTAGAEIVVQREVEADCCLEADPGLMAQALSNLLRNAIEAVSLRRERGGKQKLCVIRLLAQKRSVCCPDGTRAPRVVLCVEDNGPGIAPDIVKRMFNPFFTTRKTGTGLGLAIVHRIVDAHGGHINVASAKPHGARIEVSLPCMAKPEIEAHPSVRPGTNGRPKAAVMEVIT